MSYIDFKTLGHNSRGSGALVRTLCILGLLAAFCGQVSQAIELKDILEQAKGESQWIVDIRRELHQYPELMYNVCGACWCYHGDL